MSRAILVDERQEDTSEPTEELMQSSIETSEEEQSQEPSVPEKYQGKSVEELIQMHQELERFSGKQSAEVGNTRKEVSELRELVDGYIQTQLTENKAPEPQQDGKDEEVDFFVDPKAAVNRAIDNHPKIKEAEAYSKNHKHQATLAQLKSKFPDMENTLQDPKFVEWVKSSKIRTKLFVQADQAYDFDSANELFSNWQERNQVLQNTVNAEKAARKSSVKSATTGNARGAVSGSRKKVYRRADIIKLIKNDPDRYQALSGEILQAYAEGRVK